MKLFFKIAIPALVMTIAGFACGGGKQQPDKVDVLKAIKLSRAIARINEANAKFAQLKQISAQLDKDILPSVEEAKTLCKEAGIELEDVLSGSAKVADDGVVTRPVATKLPAPASVVPVAPAAAAAAPPAPPPAPSAPPADAKKK